MKQQHETFIAAMAEHGDPIKAYTTAYPNAKPASARTAAYRLLQEPEIIKAVTFDAKHMHKKAKAVALNKGTKRVTQQLADIQKRREVLAEMIYGTFKRKRLFKLNGELVLAEEDIPSQSVLRAIELDCKLEAGFDWTGRRTTAEKTEKEKQEPAKAGPVEPDLKDITGIIILIGDYLFDSSDSEWIERYIAWKNANPEKVREWAVDQEARSDYFVEWPEDTEGLPGPNRNFKKRQGTHSLIQIMRFGDGLPRGPFIPGQSRYFRNHKEQEAAYGPKPYDRALIAAIYNGSHDPSIQPPHSETSPMSPSGGGHSTEGRMEAGRDHTEQATPIPYPASGIQHAESSIQHQNLSIGQQNVTIQSPPNPPQVTNITENRKVYHTSDELWEAYKAALPAWPHLAEKTKRSVERMFRNNSMSQQRLLLRLKLGDRDDKNSAA